MKQQLAYRAKAILASLGLALVGIAEWLVQSPDTAHAVERIVPAPYDQLVPIARALGTTLDQLVESDEDDAVVIRPQVCASGAVTIWLLSGERSLNGVTVARMRITPERPTGPDDLAVHAGRDWFTVLSGTASLRLGDRTVLVHEGDSAEFSTMTPHAIGAHGGPVEILTVLDHDGERSHLPVGPAAVRQG